MSMVINTNVMSLNAQRNLFSSKSSLEVSMARLSSGLRINSAADDAAGLAVSQKMLGQVMGLNQAVRNANDAISMIQTAEGGMQESQTMLQRMRELATQASSDTISDTERGYINTEVQALRSEINAIADRTKFNGQSLLTGSLTTTLGGATATDLVVGDILTNATTVMASAIDVSGALAGETYTMTYASATDELTMTRSSDSVAQTITVAAMAANATQTLDFDALGVKITLQNAGAATADNIGAGLDAAADDTIVTAAGSGSATIQVGADASAGNTLSLSFDNMKIEAGGAAAMAALNTALTNFNTTSNRTNASALLSAIDTATDFVSSERSDLGAVQNRMSHVVSNLSITSENLSASRSRVVDADFAAETANLTRAQILQQAGVSMLAQANAAPQNVLALLQ